MNKKNSSFLIALIILAMTVSPLIATVMAKKPVVTEVVGYTQYVGTMGGANFVVRIPDDWNGMLVIGCHGYMMNWNPNAQFAVDNLENSEEIGLPFKLLEEGFAYAASSYGEGGWAVKNGMIRTHQLTEYVINNYGVTGKVFLIGFSMGGTMALLLGEKYPELYDGVIDISGVKNVVQAYIVTVELINSPGFPFFPLQQQLFLLSAKADYEAACGGTYDDKPKAYERINPTSHLEISTPTITVHGVQDPAVPIVDALNYEIAVAEAGRSEYYQLHTVDPGMHGNPPVIDEVLIRLWDLVGYPVGW
jgi:pimeloyl-ACP methyl ester carboxylesterase